MLARSILDECQGPGPWNRGTHDGFFPFPRPLPQVRLCSDSAVLCKLYGFTRGIGLSES
jgi:hypothetical protein